MDDCLGYEDVHVEAVAILVSENRRIVGKLLSKNLVGLPPAKSMADDEVGCMILVIPSAIPQRNGIVYNDVKVSEDVVPF